MAAPLAKQIVDAIRTRLLAMTSPTYNLPPSNVAICAFTQVCLDPSITTAYVIEPDTDTHEEETNQTLILTQPLSIVGFTNFGGTDLPYNLDGVVPDRRTLQDQLEQDLCNCLLGSADGVTLGGLVLNVASAPVTIEKGDLTYHPNFAVIYARFVPQASYVRGAA